MTLVDPRIRAARVMRDNGAPVIEIANSFGVAKSTVSRWTSPESNERSQEYSRGWKERNRERNRARDRASTRSAKGRGVCAGCGMPKGIGGYSNTHCQGCILTTAAVRRSLTEGMWADGWTLTEMADPLGLSGNTWMGVLRQRGWDLPHRRTPEQVARIREASMRGRGLAA